MAAHERVVNHRILNGHVGVVVGDRQDFVLCPRARDVIEDHIRGNTLGASAGKRNRVFASPSLCGKMRYRTNRIEVLLVVAVRNLCGVAIDGDRTGSGLAGDVIILDVLDIETVTGELNHTPNIKDDDSIGRVLLKGSAQRPRAAVVEIRHSVDRGVGKPATSGCRARKVAAEAFCARERTAAEPDDTVATPIASPAQ